MRRTPCGCVPYGADRNCLHRAGNKKRRLRDAHLRSLRFYPLLPDENTPKTAHDEPLRRAGAKWNMVLQSLYSNNTFTTPRNRRAKHPWFCVAIPLLTVSQVCAYTHCGYKVTNL